MFGFSYLHVSKKDYLSCKNIADSIKSANHNELPGHPIIEIDKPSYDFYAKYLPELFDGWISKRTSLWKLPVAYKHFYSYSWNDWKSDIYSSLNDYIESSDFDENYRELFGKSAIIVQPKYYVSDEVVQRIIDMETSDLWNAKMGVFVVIGRPVFIIPYQRKIEKAIVPELTESYLSLFYYE